jgi:hypothetical protein
MKSSQHQPPSSREIPSTNVQTVRTRTFPERGRSLARSACVDGKGFGFFNDLIAAPALRPGTGRAPLMFSAWCFSGAWRLEFGGFR